MTGCLVSVMLPDVSGNDGFAAALLNPASAVPAGIARANGGDPVQAFNVYRNNVVASLAQALKAAFPVTSVLLGDGLQRALMADYARAHPPTSPILAHYGDGFADYLAAHPATRERPFLADMARLERLKLASYHSADALALTSEVLARVDPEQLSDTVLALHAAARLFRSRFPVASIYGLETAALAGALPEGARAAIRMDKAEAMLVVRPRFDVALHALSSSQAAFFTACDDGAVLGDAAERAYETDEAFDLQSTLALGLASGAFAIPAELESSP
jgi:hypothetical protein